MCGQMQIFIIYTYGSKADLEECPRRLSGISDYHIQHIRSRFV